MSIILYFFSAFTLLRPACSPPPYRLETRTRWRKTLLHLVIYEVSGGFMGLIVLAALLWLIFVHVT